MLAAFVAPQLPDAFFVGVVLLLLAAMLLAASFFVYEASKLPKLSEWELTDPEAIRLRALAERIVRLPESEQMQLRVMMEMHVTMFEQGRWVEVEQ